MQKSITHKRSRDLAFLRLLEISRCELPWKNLLKELQFLAFLNEVLFLNLTVHMLDDVLLEILLSPSFNTVSKMCVQRWSLGITPG